FLQAPSAKEMAALKLAYEQLEKQNSSSAGALKELENKMMAAIGPKLSRLAPDIEALMQAEAIALTPGPKPKYDAYTLNILRDAILMLRQVSFIYEGGSKAGLRREVIPYGILFGGEAYLIAVEPEKQKSDRPKVWRIDRIHDAIVSNQSGGPPEDFSLREFAERSFGVFQENEIYEVILEVFPQYADEALRWVFHPNQKIKELKNGGLEIKMHGASLKELSWVLFRWCGKLKIISPKELKDEMKKALEFGAQILGKKAKK
ncbi:MAG: WYL domain-containing protein, partial [Caulobacterales bacterium]|nr:WYL domain-containing protein [Caulobacterales bacterium]